MEHQSQEKIIKRILLNEGEISRNLCLRELYISRLGAIICNLKKEGWKFRREYVKTPKGKDFVYYLVESPLKKIVYEIPELQKTITSYE